MEYDKIKLTEDGYFPNNDKKCFASSLANLIYYKFKDFNAAKNIFVNSSNHSLIGDRGYTEMICAPVILEDLSEGKYFGLLHFSPENGFINKFYNKRGVSAELIEKAYNYSLEKKLFDFINVQERIKIKGTHILFLENRSKGHALVYTGRFSINNGYKQPLFLPQGTGLIGTFEVFKNNS